MAGSVGDTSLWAFLLFLESSLSLLTPPPPRPPHTLWLIQGFCWELCLYTKTEHPWRTVELWEMFPAMLSRNIPFNFSVFITRTLQAVLILCSSAWVNGGSSVDLGGWTMPLFPHSCLCYGSGGVVFQLSHKVKPASESCSSISCQGGQHFCQVLQNAECKSWFPSCYLNEFI